MYTSADLAAASTADAASARAVLATFVQAAFPTVAVRAGPLSDLVLGPSALALAAVAGRAKASAASVNPYTALAAGGYDPAVLASALAGLGVARLTATAASGSVAVTFSDNATRTVPAASGFRTADGIVYRTTATVRLVATTGTLASATDQFLTPAPGGKYAGILPAAASVAGAAGNRAAGTALTAVSTITNLTAAAAATDFAGGVDAETDAALLARLPSAVAPRTTATALGASGLVTSAVPALAAVSVVQFGNPALTRGLSVLTGQAPGRLDVWVRPPALGRTLVTVTATLVNASGPHGIWRFATTAATVPGWVFLEKVLPLGSAATAAGYVVATTTPGYDLSGITDPATVPAIAAAPDAMFSLYATLAATFTDTDTATAGLIVGTSQKTYTASFRTVNGLAAAQAAVNVVTVRAAGGDCLVRGAAPVLTSVSVTATAPAGTTLTTAQVAAAVAAGVNANGFDNQLSAAKLTTAAAPNLPTGTVLQVTALSGTAYDTAGGSTLLTGTSSLVTSGNIALGLSAATTAYYADSETITVTLA